MADEIPGMSPRRRIAIGLGLVIAAGLFWLAVGAGALALNRARPTQPLSDAANTTPVTSGTSPSDGTPTVVVTEQATASPTSSSSGSPTLTSTPTHTTEPATATARPPTATSTATPVADLTCSQMTHAGQTLDDEHEFTAALRNQGTASVSAGYSLQWRVVSATSAYNANLPGPAVSAGDETVVAYTFDLHPFLQAGAYTGVLVIDPFNQVPEANESNNECSVNYNILPTGVTLVPATLAP